MLESGTGIGQVERDVAILNRAANGPHWENGLWVKIWSRWVGIWRKGFRQRKQQVQRPWDGSMPSVMEDQQEHQWGTSERGHEYGIRLEESVFFCP